MRRPVGRFGGIANPEINNWGGALDGGAPSPVHGYEICPLAARFRYYI